MLTSRNLFVYLSQFYMCLSNGKLSQQDRVLLYLSLFYKFIQLRVVPRNVAPLFILSHNSKCTKHKRRQGAFAVERSSKNKYVDIPKWQHAIKVHKKIVGFKNCSK